MSFPINDVYGSKSRVETEITPSERERLTKEQWRIQTHNEITQAAVAKHLAHLGLPEEPVDFYYNGKTLRVHNVPYEIVESVRNDQKEYGYEFDAFHRPSSNFTWKQWLKGVKSVGRITGARFQGVCKTTVAGKMS
jgi:hypothetical protein